MYVLCAYVWCTYIYDPGPWSWCMHEGMMHVSMMRLKFCHQRTNEPTDKAILGVGCSMPICMKQEACIYDACMCDACQNGDERTNGRTESWILGVGYLKNRCSSSLLSSWSWTKTRERDWKSCPISEGIPHHQEALPRKYGRICHVV